LDDNPLPDQTAILKMVWHPAHYERNELSGAAFAKDDLVPKIDKRDGKPRFVSVDEKCLANKAAIDKRITDQGEKNPENFRDAKFLEYICGTIRAMAHANGETPLDVRPEREQENLAHCGIHNTSTLQRSNREKDAFADDLRTLLLTPGSFKTIAYKELFPVADDGEMSPD
jgi:hypothetical protein